MGGQCLVEQRLEQFRRFILVVPEATAGGFEAPDPAYLRRPHTGAQRLRDEREQHVHGVVHPGDHALVQRVSPLPQRLRQLPLGELRRLL